MLHKRLRFPASPIDQGGQMTTFDTIIGVTFVVVASCGTAWYWRTYARTPRDQRMGLGRLAPAQQRSWNRFIACTIAVMAVLGLLATLLE